jgi:hypothetical protein
LTEKSVRLKLGWDFEKKLIVFGIQIEVSHIFEDEEALGPKEYFHHSVGTQDNPIHVDENVNARDGKILTKIFLNLLRIIEIDKIITLGL